MFLNTRPTRLQLLATWPAALFIAGILLWYEQFKLTGNPGSVWLFTVLTDWLFLAGHEKAMRLGVAAAEIVASVLVVIPATRKWGAVFALGIMSGAIFFHVVSPLGIDPYQDGGRLFTEACLVWLASAFILFVHRAALAAQVGALLGWPRRSAIV
jgi:hypothetical protein